MLPILDRRAWLGSLFFGSGSSTALVTVFLRGGADGLNMVVPRFDPDYARLRPTLALRDSIDWDGRFGLHPGFEPLLRYRSRLAVVHAVGSDDSTRSHFEAQDLMERAGRPEEGVAGGWLARHPRSANAGAGAIAAVSIGPTLPESLRGAPSAAALESIEEASLAGSPEFSRALGRLYEADGTVLGGAGQSTMALVSRLEALRGAPVPEGYPSGSFGASLSQVARLIKADVGLQVATVDFGGWDTHYVQAAVFASNVAELAQGLSAFAGDLGERLDRTILLVMTEFGRRAYENETLGTDHGRASVMLALGGPVRGGRTIAEWPGLSSLEGPGDLRVTIDYRDILAEVISRGLGNSRCDLVFPGFTPKPRGLI